MGPQLEGLVQSRPELRLYKIDIGKWGSPVAQQFGINRLPTVWLYEGKERVESDTRQALQRIQGG